MNQRFACVCCGYRTLDEEPPGTFQICPVCYWEDDGVQAADESATGANAVSLLQAKENFRSIGASDSKHRTAVLVSASNHEPRRADPGA